MPEMYGDYVHEYKVEIKKSVNIKPSKIPTGEILKLIKASPELEDALQNWGEDSNVAFNNAFRHMIDADTPFEAFLNVWYDFYKNSPKEFVQEMVKLGYDGVIIPPKSIKTSRQTDVTHLVIYNLNCLKRIE